MEEVVIENFSSKLKKSDLTHFWSITSKKQQKTFGFLAFQKAIKWPNIG